MSSRVICFPLLYFGLPLDQQQPIKSHLSVLTGSQRYKGSMTHRRRRTSKRGSVIRIFAAVSSLTSNYQGVSTLCATYQCSAGLLLLFLRLFLALQEVDRFQRL